MGCDATCPDWDPRPCLGLIPGYDCFRTGAHGLAAAASSIQGDWESTGYHQDETFKAAKDCAIGLIPILGTAIGALNCLESLFDGAAAAACNAFSGGRFFLSRNPEIL